MLKIETYANVDWVGNIRDKRSASGYYVFFGYNLVQQSSRKQKFVSLSSIEAKYKSFSQVSTTIARISHLLEEIQVEYTSPTVVWY